MIHITEDVLAHMREIAIAAMPRETGGLLIGWIEGEAVSVVDLITVLHPRPERSRYLLDAARANAALDEYLAATQGKHLGYVGSWHTHPAMAGPSPLDMMTFRRVTRRMGIPLAFVVAATDGHSTRFHAIWAVFQGRRPRLMRQPTITRQGT